MKNRQLFTIYWQDFEKAHNKNSKWLNVQSNVQNIQVITPVHHQALLKEKFVNKTVICSTKTNISTLPYGYDQKVNEFFL